MSLSNRGQNSDSRENNAQHAGPRGVSAKRGSTRAEGILCCSKKDFPPRAPAARFLILNSTLHPLEAWHSRPCELAFLYSTWADLRYFPLRPEREWRMDPVGGWWGMTRILDPTADSDGCDPKQCYSESSWGQFSSVTCTHFTARDFALYVRLLTLI